MRHVPGSTSLLTLEHVALGKIRFCSSLHAVLVEESNPHIGCEYFEHTTGSKEGISSIKWVRFRRIIY